MTTYRPMVERPIYLDGAPPDVALPALKAAASDACKTCRETPGAGLIGATLLGVTAAYFAPKFFDWILPRLQGHGHDQDDEFDLEVEPR